MPEFSRFIVYADESGSASLGGTPDPNYPVFVLAMTMVDKEDYANSVVPEIQRLKFKYSGHDQIILHERDIRRQKDQFAFLQADSELRDSFINDINELITNCPFNVYASVIRKIELLERYADPWDPYEIALYFLMERILRRLVNEGETGKIVHVIFECRGAKEDADLEYAFLRIATNQSTWGYIREDFTQVRWVPRFVDKKSNSTGIQLADLVARPIGLKILRPLQKNRAYDIIAPKLAPNGLKIFP